MSNFDFQLELGLKAQNPELAHRHACCISLFEKMLQNYIAVFPNFTDHTLLHTLNVTNISNLLLGEEASKLNADEIYIYLMATALHDIGMAVSNRDLDPFIDAIGLRPYINDHPELSMPDFIRKYHNDFSAAFVMKYWQLLDIPDKRYAEAIAKVAKGHRKVDLMDRSEYPTVYELAEDKQVNIAMLAALLRIADELDVASDRNPVLLYNLANVDHMSERAILEFSRHRAIHSTEISGNEIIITSSTDNKDIALAVINTARDVDETLQYCRRVIRECSDLCLSSEKTRLILNQVDQPF